MRELVEDDRRVEGGVPVRRRDEAHVHRRARPVDGRVHVRRPEHRARVRARVDAIDRGPAAAEVVLLEVAVGLAEPEQVADVVHVAAVVEDVQDLLVVAGRVGGIEGHDAVRRRSRDRRAGAPEMGEGRIAGRLVRSDPRVGERPGQSRADLEERVVAAARGVVRPARRALRAGVPREEQPLALLAPAPPVLAERERRLVDQRVVAAPGLVVRAAGRALRAGVAGEEEALALVAPAPVRLARVRRRVLHQPVVAAAGLVVRAAGRALRAGIAGEEEPLALVAPAPVLLARRRKRKAVVPERTWEARLLTRRAAVDAVHVADGRNRLDDLVAVEDLARGRVDEGDVLPRVVGHRQEDLQREVDAVAAREPRQVRLDLGAERPGVERRRTLGHVRESRSHLRREALDVDRRRPERLTELVDRAPLVGVRRRHVLRGARDGVLHAELRRRGRIGFDRHRASDGVDDRAVRGEPHGRGGLEDRDAPIALLEVDGALSAARRLDDRVGEELRRLIGEAEGGRNRLDVLQRPPDVVVARRRRCDRDDGGRIAGRGVDLLHLDPMCPRQSLRHVGGGGPQSLRSRGRRPAGSEIAHVELAAHRLPPVHVGRPKRATSPDSTSSRNRTLSLFGTFASLSAADESERPGLCYLAEPGTE